MAAWDHQPARPVWLDEDFLKIVIKNDLNLATKEAVEVGELKVRYVVPKGENYLSDILRVTVAGDFGQDCAPKHANGVKNGKGYKDERKYILKVLHQTEDMKVFLEEQRAFDKEVDMMQRMLPALEALLEKAGLPTSFAARQLHNLPDLDVIAMEDLSEKGFVLANRHRGANLDECKVLYRKQARLHAASMRYYEQKSLNAMKPMYYKAMVADAETEQSQKVLDVFFGRDVLESKMLTLADDVLQRPGYEREHELFVNIKDIAYDLTYHMYAYKPGNIFNALLHGDCWLNNMLYKYDANGRPTDVRLIDLQLACYNSVANDFMYFFLSSASDEVRRRHYEELTRFYFDHLTETLARVGYEATHPTYDQFQEELMKASSMFIIQLSMIVPILKGQLSAEQKDRSKSGADSMDEIMKFSDENRTNPVYLDCLFATLDMMRDQGIVEYHEKLHKERSGEKKPKI